MVHVTIGDLFAQGRRIARMDSQDYAGSIYAWRADANTRRRQRQAASRLRSYALLAWNEIIPAGQYGRISIGEDGEIDYTPDQYAPTEYYFHVEQLLRTLRRRKEKDFSHSRDAGC